MNLTGVLRPLPSSIRTLVYQRFPRGTKLNPANKRRLEQVLFEIQDELESRGVQRANCLTLNTVRSVLSTDVGIDEPLPTARYPHCDAVEKLMRKKTRKGGTGEGLRAYRLRSETLQSEPSKTDDTSSDEDTDE